MNFVPMGTGASKIMRGQSRNDRPPIWFSILFLVGFTAFMVWLVS